MIKTLAIRKEYDGRVVLDVPAMEFEEGKIYAIIGANGSGKTTFGRNCGIPYQPQKPYAFRMSVLKNLMLANDNENAAMILLEALDMKAFAKKRADKLSGGETAKMALARSLMSGQDLVLDEPTAAMDMKGSILAEKLIQKYAKKGRTVILITHSIRQARRIADEIIFLQDGQINKSQDDLRKFIEYYE